MEQKRKGKDTYVYCREDVVVEAQTELDAKLSEFSRCSAAIRAEKKRRTPGQGNLRSIDLEGDRTDSCPQQSLLLGSLYIRTAWRVLVALMGTMGKVYDETLVYKANAFGRKPV